MHYADIRDAIEGRGLRIVIVKQLPSPWGVAAKAMRRCGRLMVECRDQLGGVREDGTTVEERRDL